MVWVRKSALRDEWSFGHFFKIKNYSTFKDNGSMIHHEDKGKRYWVNGLSLWDQWGAGHCIFCAFFLGLPSCKHEVHTSSDSLEEVGKRVSVLSPLLHASFILKSSQEVYSYASVKSLSRVRFFVSPWPLQHARPPCPSPTLGVYSNSCPSSQWCHPASRLQSFPASGSFQMSTLYIRWQKYWSFSFNISPSNEYSGLISPCSPRGSQESSPTPQFKSINSSTLSFLYSPTLTSAHEYWKNHSFDWMDLCW